MKVLLEQGVWLADGEGDPSRTIIEENAKEFKTYDEALKALVEARKYHHFKNACIQDNLI